MQTAARNDYRMQGRAWEVRTLTLMTMRCSRRPRLTGDEWI
jgi:hypothetical protein